MHKPTLEESRGISQGGEYGVLPLCTEIFADTVTPINALRILKNVSRTCFLLESVEDTKKWGRYTFLGFDPKLTIAYPNGEDREPSQRIQKVLDEHKSPSFDWLPPFTGGLVGYFSYDFAKYGEPSLNLDADDEERFNDVDLMLFDKIIAFDNFRQKIILIVNISLKTEDLDAEYQRGVSELNKLSDLLKTGKPYENVPAKITSNFRPLFNEKQYCDMVLRAKEYIRGSARRLPCFAHGEPVAVYVLLRQRGYRDCGRVARNARQADRRPPLHIPARRDQTARFHRRAG